MTGEDGVEGVVPRVAALLGRNGVQIHDPIEDASVLEAASTRPGTPRGPHGPRATAHPPATTRPTATMEGNS